MTESHPAQRAFGQDHEGGHGAEQQQHGEPLPGPIDWGAWLVSIVGLLAGGAVAAVLEQAIAHG